MTTCVIAAHGMGCKREEVDPGELLAQIVETHARSQNTHTHTLLPTLSALKTSLSPKEADSALCQRGIKKKEGEKKTLIM